MLLETLNLESSEQITARVTPPDGEKVIKKLKTRKNRFSYMDSGNLSSGTREISSVRDHLVSGEVKLIGEMVDEDRSPVSDEDKKFIDLS